MRASSIQDTSSCVLVPLCPCALCACALVFRCTGRIILFFVLGPPRPPLHCGVAASNGVHPGLDIVSGFLTCLTLIHTQHPPPTHITRAALMLSASQQPVWCGAAGSAPLSATRTLGCLCLCCFCVRCGCRSRHVPSTAANTASTLLWVHRYMEGQVADAVCVVLPGGRVCLTTTVRTGVVEAGDVMDGRHPSVHWSCAVTNTPPAAKRSAEVRRCPGVGAVLVPCGVLCACWCCVGWLLSYVLFPSSLLSPSSSTAPLVIPSPRPAHAHTHECSTVKYRETPPARLQA
jgi:hypothetical protein